MSRGRRRRGRAVTPAADAPAASRAATVTASATVEPVRTPTRRERRLAVRRRRLTRLAAVVAGLLVVTGAGAGGWWLISGRDGTPGPSDRPPGSATATTVLLQVTTDDGTGVGAALLGAGRDERSSVLMVPVRLMVEVPGIGSQPLAEAVDLPRPELAAKAISDLVALRVDATWTLPVADLARLVDEVGGVTVDVDREVLHTRDDGSAVVVVPEGSQHLDGLAATEFATWSAPNEPDQTRSARLKKVLQAVLTELPGDADAVAKLADGLGTRVPAELDLAALLADLHADTTDGQVDYDVLPTRVLETGGAQEALTVDARAAAAMVKRLFPAAVRATGEAAPTRVLVQNGVGTAGLGEKARDKLVAAGFAFVAGGNAPQLGVASTVVVIRDATPASRTTGAAVAAALGVPADAVRISARDQTVADVVVILGADFRP